MAEKPDYRQEVTEQIIALMENGEAPWQKPWDSSISAKILKRPYNVTRDYGYRGGNSMKLLIAGLKLDPTGDPRWCTFLEANKNGWKIKKGSKAHTVEFWKYPGAGVSKDEETGDVSIQKPRKPSVFYSKVFHASQIEGIPPYKPEAVDVTWSPIEKAERILVQSGAKIHFNQVDSAGYYPLTDTISMPPKAAFATAEKFYEVALHEMGHWTSHEKRLKRHIENSFGSKEYAKEELRAEMASLYLSMETGIPFDPGNHATYVKDWLKVLKEDKNEFFRAARDAEHITDYLLKFALEKRLEQDQTPNQKIFNVEQKAELLNDERRRLEQMQLLSALCQYTSAVFKTEETNITFSQPANEGKYQVTLSSSEAPSVQHFKSVRETMKYLYAHGATAENVSEKLIGELTNEQKRLMAILKEEETRFRPTLSKVYKLQFQELLGKDIPYSEIDVNIAKNLLKDGHVKSNVQSVITRFSPQVVLDKELKYSSKILQQIMPELDKKVGKAIRM